MCAFLFLALLYKNGGIDCFVPVFFPSLNSAYGVCPISPHESFLIFFLMAAQCK